LSKHAIFALPRIVVSVPYFATFWLFLLLVIFKKAYSKLTRLIYPAGIVNLKEIDENVDEYFDSLKEKARVFIVSEEKRCRENLQFSILTDKAYSTLQEMLIKQTTGSKTFEMKKSAQIQGCFSYDILANPFYQEAF